MSPGLGGVLVIEPGVWVEVAAAGAGIAREAIW